MMRFYRTAFVALGLATAGCSGNALTAPSSAASDPVTVVTTPPLPAPVSQTLTGTWFLDSQNFMTLTERDATVTGMEAPSTKHTAQGLMSTRRGVISGTVSGTDVVLTFALTVTVSDGRITSSCSGTDTFAGSISGNTLAGIYKARTADYRCGSVAHAVLPTIDGPISFTRQ
jgi:hypothetical protein